MVILGGVLNAFVLLPAYVYFTSSFESVADIIAIGTKENSAINNMSTFIFYAVVPFNLIKGVLDALITILIYKNQWNNKILCSDVRLCLYKDIEVEYLSTNKN